MVLVPNSWGSSLVEEWSDEARAAALVARHAHGVGHPAPTPHHQPKPQPKPHHRRPATRSVIKKKLSKRRTRAAIHQHDAARYAEIHKPVPHDYRELRALGTYD